MRLRFHPSAAREPAKTEQRGLFFLAFRSLRAERATRGFVPCFSREPFNRAIALGERQRLANIPVRALYDCPLRMLFCHINQHGIDIVTFRSPPQTLTLVSTALSIRYGNFVKVDGRVMFIARVDSLSRSCTDSV
jgi:hypothetical protein